MNSKQVLEELGLSQGEIKVYLALLKLGQVTVKEIKKETELHRTTIYDFLEKLINKGLTSYVVKANINYYKAIHPSKLFDFIKEKEEHLKQIMPDLKKLVEFVKEDISVEVLKGKEGFKTLLNLILREKKDYHAFGIEEELFEKKFGVLMTQHFKKEAKAGISEKLLSREGTKFTYKYPHVKYRFIPEEYFDPTPTIIVSDYVFILIWEPLTGILIKSKALANSYRKHFNLLWKIAKKS